MTAGWYGLAGYRPWRHELRIVGGRFYVSPRRKPGTPEEVELARRALEFLADVTDQEVAEQDAEANRRGLTGRARREFYLTVELSDGWHRANKLAAAALDRISPGQERRIRAAL